MNWKIGKIKIDNQVVLVPMSGVNDYVFRHIIKSMGCGLIESEMISTKSVYIIIKRPIECCTAWIKKNPFQYNYLDQILNHLRLPQKLLEKIN